MKRAGRKYKKMAPEIPNHDDSELDIKLRSLLEEKNEMITKATITKDGQLTPLYQYLEDYATGN